MANTSIYDIEIAAIRTFRLDFGNQATNIDSNQVDFDDRIEIAASPIDGRHSASITGLRSTETVSTSPYRPIVSEYDQRLRVAAIR